MKSFFTSKFFSNNRTKLKQLHNSKAPIVVSANGLLQRGADSTYEFSQDANFWYLTGLNEPDLLLVMLESEEFIVVPARSTNREIFDGSVATQRLVERSGVKNIYDESLGWEKLDRLIKSNQAVATIPPASKYIDSLGFYANPARRSLLDRLKENHKNVNVSDLNQYVVNLRMIKQKEELAAIGEAINITASTFDDIFEGQADLYSHEYQVEAKITQGFRGRGASGHAFTPIVANGKNACTLHYITNNDKLDKNALTVIDIGAEVEHYAADITRTKALANPSKRQIEVYEAVLDVQAYAKSRLKPGVLIKEYEKHVEEYMGSQLKKLKLIKTINHDNVRRYFPHATSHFLGLNVHDVGDYSRPLEPNMVLTVEPGIYIPEESIGVRIEDDILITNSGIKNMSQAISNSLR